MLEQGAADNKNKIKVGKKNLIFTKIGQRAKVATKKAPAYTQKKAGGVIRKNPPAGRIIKNRTNISTKEIKTSFVVGKQAKIIKKPAATAPAKRAAALNKQSASYTPTKQAEPAVWKNKTLLCIRKRKAKIIRPPGSDAMRAANAQYISGIDGVYHSFWVGRLIRLFVKEGKAATAERHFYAAFRELFLETGRPGNTVLAEAMSTVAPLFAIKRRRTSRRKVRYYPLILTPLSRYNRAVNSLKDEIVKYWRQETDFDTRVADVLRDGASYLKRTYARARKWTLKGPGGAIEHRRHARWTWRASFK